MTQKQPTSPLRLKVALAEAKRREELASVQTQITDAIRIRPESGKAIVPIGLPLDQRGRPYLKINNPYERTLLLIKASIDRYVEIQGAYPAIILLNVWRRLDMIGFNYFYIGEQAIPYAWEYGAKDYDVLCRGEVRS